MADWITLKLKFVQKFKFCYEKIAKKRKKWKESLQKVEKCEIIENESWQ
ncbi:MAG: hypothetical protein II838_06850 [Lachnospiraceae bacterium]|nr:hypothetical protein [Lachnospiraceae bacterium]